MTAPPTLTAAQVRQARALLRWSSPKLTKASKISFDMVIKAQDDADMATLSHSDVWAIRTALERAGVRVAFDAEGRPGAEVATNQQRS
ncbi:hypothetical protein [Lichenibacterium dinghuense]|uniref:hypothetical protein n=1 Tax=Lichenibacterium dinghuense TaxID=2895977 RepID=UPI001F34AB31|nr:hypothetical protein [Lichenibacterium sp. 6Y81]